MRSGKRLPGKGLLDAQKKAWSESYLEYESSADI